jgi:hypothetical protein
VIRVATVETVEVCDGEIRIENVKVLPGNWNGWALPVFTSEQVDELIRQQEALALKSECGYEVMPFFDRQGEVVIEYDFNVADYDEEPTVHIPGDDGCYAIGTYSWTWEVAGDEPPLERLSRSFDLLFDWAELDDQHADLDAGAAFKRMMHDATAAKATLDELLVVVNKMADALKASEHSYYRANGQPERVSVVYALEDGEAAIAALAAWRGLQDGTANTKEII